MYYPVKPKPRPKLPSDVRRHFIKRLKERYEIEITMKECKGLEKQTFKFFIERENRFYWWYLLKIKDRWVYCLFNRRYGLTTALTPEQFWSNHPGWKLRRPRYKPEQFVEAWIVSREDQKRYQSKNIRLPDISAVQCLTDFSKS